ncbi:unnamed protein product [Cuscuta epithymum]|uniref:RING-type E3 ubiquitin transferase n=1 Tax=Cuscuta epithymum TaxID=186058 RepID=A0AAV0F3R2_9ASTE|nr:unnamed protein product [Cuscuta epithymum]
MRHRQIQSPDNIYAFCRQAVTKDPLVQSLLVHTYIQFEEYISTDSEFMMMVVPHQESGTLITAVAIDKDKNSQYAVKWAIENLPKKSRNLILVHVIVQLNMQSQDYVTKEGRPPTNDEVQNIFLPFRGSCARKGVTAKEVVLVSLDVINALAEYICASSISTIVLGASSRNVLARAFKNVDVPTGLGKFVPDFCSVYVVSSRGRVQNIRVATRPPAPSNYSRQSSQSSLCLSFPDTVSSSTDFSSQVTWKSGGSLADTDSFHSGFSERKGGPCDNGHHNRKNPLSPPLSNHSFESTSRSQWENLSSTTSSSSDNSQMAPLNRQLGSKDMSSSSPQQSMYNKTSSPSCPPFKANTMLNNVNQRGRSRDTSFCSVAESELSGPTNYSSSVSYEYSSISEAAGNSHSSSVGVRKVDEWKSEEMQRLEHYRRTQEDELVTMEREKHKTKEALEMGYHISANEVQYRRYNIEEIEIATNYFSKSGKIGEGGYGPVYKAILDHTSVAIKVLRPDIPQGHKQFKQEIEVLSRIRHPNMVLLLGACDEYGCLVYEYMENGSLDDRLFCKNNTTPIPWMTRFAIAAEIATALNFLHHAKPAPLVHRDLKPANILLDKNYVSKISDVGLARLVPPSVADCVTQYQLTAAAGTFCYIDPEYQQTGKLSTKSDIYSLGVLLLQIITARPPMGLKHHVERAIDDGKFGEILDPAVKDWPIQDAMAYAKVALKCCELKGRDRPDLGSVVLPELERLRNISYRKNPLN